jgi:hypothetical protein
MIWPDTMALGPERWLYFICNQLNRQAQFHGGKDQRQQPYVLFRTRLDRDARRIADAPGSPPVPAR